MKDNIMDSLAARLSELMQFESLSISNLARLVNIPSTTMNCCLNKARLPKVDAVVKLADYFNVSTDCLLGRIDI